MNGRENDQKAAYTIQLQGMLDPGWSDWFDGFTIHNQSGFSTMYGHVADQSALLGILTRILGLGMILIKVERKLDKDD